MYLLFFTLLYREKKFNFCFSFYLNFYKKNYNIFYLINLQYIFLI